MRHDIFLSDNQRETLETTYAISNHLDLCVSLILYSERVSASLCISVRSIVFDCILITYMTQSQVFGFCKYMSLPIFGTCF